MCCEDGSFDWTFLVGCFIGFLVGILVRTVVGASVVEIFSLGDIDDFIDGCSESVCGTNIFIEGLSDGNRDDVCSVGSEDGWLDVFLEG